MNQKILQKAISGLQEGLKDSSLRETKIIYVLGMLETLAELNSSQESPVMKQVFTPEQSKAALQAISSDPEAAAMDLMVRANLNKVKSGMTEE